METPEDLALLLAAGEIPAGERTIGDPKPKRERLKRNSVAWKRRVRELFERDDQTCAWCGQQFSFAYLAPCHIKSVGSGGGDELSNLKTGCKECHTKEHMGL